MNKLDKKCVSEQNRHPIQICGYKRRNSQIGLLWNSTQLVGREETHSFGARKNKERAPPVLCDSTSEKFTATECFFANFFDAALRSRISIPSQARQLVCFLWDATAVPNSCIRNDEGRIKSWESQIPAALCDVIRNKKKIPLSSGNTITWVI